MKEINTNKHLFPFYPFYLIHPVHFTYFFVPLLIPFLSFLFLSASHSFPLSSLPINLPFLSFPFHFLSFPFLSSGYSTGHSRCSSLNDLSHHRNTSSSSGTSCGLGHPSQPLPSTPTEPHRQATPTKPERPPPPSAVAILSNRSSR